MRHRVKTKTLHRDRDHRKALIKNLSTSLVLHEEIVTTLTKAKYIRPHFEKLVTKAKNGADFNNIKLMNRKLTSKDAVKKMLDDLGPRFKDRVGGYTRITKLANRDGDNAPMARIELVDKPEAKKVTTKKTEEKKVVEKEPAKKAKATPKKSSVSKKVEK